MALQDDGHPEQRFPDDGQHGLNRRDVLHAGLFAAAAGILTAVGITATDSSLGGVSAAVIRPTGTGRDIEPAGGRGRAHVLAPGSLDSVALPAGSEPAWMHTWAHPISRLDAYTAHRLDVRFPKRAVMLTIDDGPHPVWTPRYLRLLAKHHVTATFNVIGEQVHGNTALLKAMAGEGHVIGNHTFHHPLNLPSLSTRRIRSELLDTTDAIVRATGFRPRQFRAPGGVWGPDVFAEVARQKMMPLGWDIDPRDWALPGVAEIRRAMLAARPHDVILCHDGGGNRSETYRALETVVPALLARGWQFVTLPAPQ